MVELEVVTIILEATRITAITTAMMTIFRITMIHIIMVMTAGGIPTTRTATHFMVVVTILDVATVIMIIIITTTMTMLIIIPTVTTITTIVVTTIGTVVEIPEDTEDRDGEYKYHWNESQEKVTDPAPTTKKQVGDLKKKKRLIWAFLCLPFSCYFFCSFPMWNVCKFIF